MAEVVHTQLDLGVDSINDGEMSKSADRSRKDRRGLGSTSRDEGRLRVTYNGTPLYY